MKYMYASPFSHSYHSLKPQTKYNSEIDGILSTEVAVWDTEGDTFTVFPKIKYMNYVNKYFLRWPEQIPFLFIGNVCLKIYYKHFEY